VFEHIDMLSIGIQQHLKQLYPSYLAQISGFWSLALVLEHGSQRWLSVLALSAGSQRWFSALALSAGSQRWGARLSAGSQRLTLALEHSSQHWPTDGDILSKCRRHRHGLGSAMRIQLRVRPSHRNRTMQEFIER
jgi:hypothetical protein